MNHQDSKTPRSCAVPPGNFHRFFLVSLCLGGLFFSAVPALGQGAAPQFSATGPDAEAYGSKNGYPPGERGKNLKAQGNLVGTLSRYDQIVKSNKVERGDTVWQFKRWDKALDVKYRYQNAQFSIADYLARNPVTGLLVARDDTILIERYQYARSDADRFTSQSMAKTVIAMLVGIAVEEGKLRSLGDSAEAYVPGLKGSEFGRTPIRALLRMSSGIAFTEDYGGNDDSARFSAGLFSNPATPPARVVARFNDRVAPPDTLFNYSGPNTETLGLILSAVTGRSVASYLSEKIWKPLGMEADASWSLDNSGQELAFCCLNAVLRDYARLGRLLAHDGDWNGRRIVPRQWVIDATTLDPKDGHLAPKPGSRYYGYGYQTWIFPGERRMFAFLGIHGQSIFVDPASKLVMVNTAVRVKPANDPASAETRALWHGLVAALGKQ
jgi:CubicO group peptidase (beta-lactamase class C family)